MVLGRTLPPLPPLPTVVTMEVSWGCPDANDQTWTRFAGPGPHPGRHYGWARPGDGARAWVEKGSIPLLFLDFNVPIRMSVNVKSVLMFL
jgi:hypothetical protein